MPRHPKPVGPRPVLTRLVNKRLANIENNRLYHSRILHVRRLTPVMSCAAYRDTGRIDARSNPRPHFSAVPAPGAGPCRRRGGSFGL